MTRLCDLPDDLVGEKILAQVPITSLKAVRSTCKLWNALSKKYLPTRMHHEFVRFTTVDDKVCSLRFHLDLVPPSIKQVALLNQVKISLVFHCQGLVLCVTNSKLVVWNPYLGKTWWIEPGNHFDKSDSYVLGYDNNGNHKILRSCNSFKLSKIYDFSSESWRDLEITSEDDDFIIDDYQRGVTLKGNAYFFAKVDIPYPPGQGPAGYESAVLRLDVFLLCFDFTKETLGQRLSLPFNSYVHDTVTLSSVREEQLAVLYETWNPSFMLEIWVTNKIEPDAISWSKFLVVDMTPLTGFAFEMEYGCFFIDEEKKVAVVFDLDGAKRCYQTAYIIGEDGYFKSVSLEDTPDVKFPRYQPLLVSSSYLPSLVQIKS